MLYNANGGETYVIHALIHTYVNHAHIHTYVINTHIKDSAFLATPPPRERVL